jgi:hypothetical protein
MARVVSVLAKDALLTVSVMAHQKEAVEKAAAEQQDKEEGRQQLADVVRRKGAEKSPALAEPWGRPRTEHNMCRNAKVTCVWPSGNTKWIRSCERCQGQKAGCKIDGALDPWSWILKPKPVRGSSGQMVADRYGCGGGGKWSWELQGHNWSQVQRWGKCGRGRGHEEPSANTTVGQLIWLVAMQSEHMAWLEAQVGQVADGLERQLEWVMDQVEWIRDQVGRIVGVMERVEGWSMARGGGRLPRVERPRTGSEQRGADDLSGPLMIIE